MTIRTSALAAILAILSFGTSFAGESVSANAEVLLQKAKNGDADAQWRIASMYDTGTGVPRNGKEAMKWYRASAEQGNAEAQNSLGSALQAERRYEEALPWYERAAAQGHALATNNLAYLYDLGLGVEQDRKKGFELYSVAANLGWAEAMWNIANMYGAGQLGKKDLVQACIWTVRAARFATPNEKVLIARTSNLIPRVEANLSKTDAATCREQGSSWSPSARAPN